MPGIGTTELSGGRVRCGTTAPTAPARPAPEPLEGRLRVDADDVQTVDVRQPRHRHRLPGQQQRAPSGPRGADGGRRGQGGRAGPAGAGQEERAHRALPDTQPSTRFLSSLSAVSRMTFSALRLIMPEQRHRQVDGDRVGDLGAAVGVSARVYDPSWRFMIWPLTRVQDTFRSPSQV